MEELLNIIQEFKSKKVLIVGDLILDKYIEGSVSRISQEAPVPILNVKKEFYVLGGAGNVASNISSLGGKATLFAFVGEDYAGEILKNMLIDKEIESFVQVAEYPTTKKTRLIGNNQQLIRIDEEDISEKHFRDDFKAQLIEMAKKADVIIISDYFKGVITKDLMDLLVPYRSKIIIDPKPQNKSLYYDAYLITPNEKEALALSGKSDAISAGISLKKELNSNILITRGEKGITLFLDNIIEVPTYAREVYDVSGAGDTLIATVSLALASGLNLEKAAILANYAAGIVVEKKGTYSLSAEELKSVLTSKTKKIVSLNHLKKIVEQLKKENKKIVWTSGCFDLLHIGHTRYLKDARALGDVLILGLNSDDSIKRIKGPSRPIQSEEERAEILASLGFVDYIFIFPEDSPLNYIRELKPDVYAKGGDYNIDSINQEERKVVEDYKGQIKLVALSGGKSTTNIIKKILDTNK